LDEEEEGCGEGEGEEDEVDEILAVGAREAWAGWWRSGLGIGWEWWGGHCFVEGEFSVRGVWGGGERGVWVGLVGLVTSRLLRLTSCQGPSASQPDALEERVRRNGSRAASVGMTGF